MACRLLNIKPLFNIVMAYYQLEHILKWNLSVNSITYRQENELLALCVIIGYRWIPHTNASDTELWDFLRSAPESTLEQTMKTPVIWDAITLIVTSL